MSMFPIPEVGFNGGTTVERGAQTIAHVAGWQMDGAGLNSGRDTLRTSEAAS